MLIWELSPSSTTEGKKIKIEKFHLKFFFFFFFEKAKEMLDKPQNNWHHGNTEI